ncbi:MAG: sulfatase-like hydrolase/transferase [Acidobacteriota bacterium]|nr:MAG: sulfatase-like hydrolase/transferase [Acidobacteriota bacterium]
MFSQITKRIPLLLFFLGLACLPSCQTGQPVRPNVLFLFADDQRADTVHAWGNPYIETPNLDRLVREGFSFRSNYNMGGNSGAVCVPSRAMVNSGRAYFRIEHNLSGSRILPEVLRENGYTTFATGKWHNEKESWLRGFERGKNIFFGGMSNHLEVPLFDLSPQGELINERIGDRFSSEMFADAAVEFLRNYSDEKPFYAYVAFTAPHDPRQPPVEFREKYYAARPPLPKNFMPQHPFNLGKWLTVRDEVLAGFPRQESVISDQLAEYYGLVNHLDTQIGRVLDALEESAHRENTIVIYAADHGLAVGSHGVLGKQSVYEHSQKCPLIFAGPEIPNGSSDALTYLLDIFPTLMSQLGVEGPADLDGGDLSAIWKGEDSRVRDSLFLSFTDHMRSVRDDRYKLILYPQVGHRQLFDLLEDPDELENLAMDLSQAKRVEEMSSLISEWQTRLGDTQPLSVEDPLPMDVDLTGFKREPDRWQPDWIVEKYFSE